MNQESHLIYPWTIIAAMSPSRGIGYEGKLPWNLPEELKWFKENTARNTIVMGKNTWESIGKKPLPNRLNVILSTTLSDQNLPDTVIIVRNLQELTRVDFLSKVFIIGGEMLYKATLPLCQELLLTYVHQDYPADTFFPSYEEWFDEEAIIRTTPDFTIRRHLRKVTASPQ